MNKDMQDTKGELDAISRTPHLPPFLSEKPTLWFTIAEAIFSRCRIINDLAKYEFVIAQLDCKYLLQIEDVINSPPAENKYIKLKEELIKRLSISERQRIRQLLLQEELGDRSPSQFLRHLRSLVETTTVDNSLLREIWIQRLPAQTQQILQTQINGDLEELASLADKICEIAQPPVVAATSNNQQQDIIQKLIDKNDQLTQRVEDLTEQLAKLTYRSRLNLSANRNCSPFRQDRSNHFFRPRSTSRSRNRKTFCWYHAKFGKKARKCESHCSFREENSNGKE
ncbi:uncharacterized protein LOC113390949 [Ctenocephalides felis]|uniref:uncharacterized protein LOC113390949 n=1 Tax=Ctenocephalides felis TaxID=7515 RepID=UPI000E6E293D|nr:uncharacterized protein LOC113390949 [Ctenocephalides felis]